MCWRRVSRRGVERRAGLRLHGNIRLVPGSTKVERPSAEVERGRLQDTDSAAAARNLTALMWSSAAGAMGALAGFVRWGLAGAVVGAALGWGVALYVARLVAGGAGLAMGQIYHPSGASTPNPREYSEPQALVHRGLFQEAIDCYETYVVEYPEDPEPCIRIARVYRDHFKQYEDAVMWFRRARQTAGIDRRREVLVTREIIELYTGALNQPRRAIPELARLAERFAGSQEGDVAREELFRLRATLSERESDSS
jgi:tetratricopeptide (TPR) repeat protein